MNTNPENYPELTHDEYTEHIYDATCFGEPVDPDNAADIMKGIDRAMTLDDYPLFLEGISVRLNQLGMACSVNDKDIMLAEIKKRYKSILRKSCPRTVQEWVKGTNIPGTENRQNHYELCWALEMNYQQTADFFQKNYLTLPFHIKNKIDAVFMYALYHKRPYSAIVKMLSGSRDFVPQESAHTGTSHIRSAILNIDDDEVFMQYLSRHCYGNEQQFQSARYICNKEIDKTHEKLRKYEADRILSPDRLNSLTIEALLGYKYQNSKKNHKDSRLPKRFTKSIPNDVTLAKIIKGEETSYELLRKTLMLLKFYNFYSEAENCDPNTICCNLMDFYEELNTSLISCGFAQLYVRHPFDCLLLYCANSYDPIDTLYCVIESGRN